VVETCAAAAGICANRRQWLIRGFLFVPHMFFSFSYTLAGALAGDSTSDERRTSMTQMALFAESELRRELSRLLRAAVEESGRARCEIARETGIHKDALRRILGGSRSASLAEALRILAAAGAAPQAHLVLFLAAGGNQATSWLQSDLARFFENLICELPSALERVLGNQIYDVKPRWAKGTAHRVARLLGDHIDELNRKDAMLAESCSGTPGSLHG
jgi:hypothetical protein